MRTEKRGEMKQTKVKKTDFTDANGILHCGICGSLRKQYYHRKCKSSYIWKSVPGYAPAREKNMSRRQSVSDCRSISVW